MGKVELNELKQRQNISSLVSLITIVLSSSNTIWPAVQWYSANVVKAFNKLNVTIIMIII